MRQNKPVLDIGNPLQIIVFRERCLTWYGSCPLKIGNAFTVTVHARRYDRKPTRKLRKKNIIKIYTVDSLDEVDRLLEKNPHTHRQVSICEVL